MAEISIERLHLSVRASNVLHRMGIHSIEKLQVTPMEKIAAQRNIGVKTLGEIQAALRDLDTLLKQPVTSKRRSVRLEEDLQGEEEERVIALTEKQREELSKHSIEELNLSVRSYRVLCREGCRTLDRVVLAVPVFSTLRGLGRKSVDEIKEAVAHWLNEHFEEAGDLSEATVEEGLKSRLQELSTELHPVAALRWEQLYHYLEAEQLLQQAQHFEKQELLRTVLLLPQLKRPLRSFWEGLSRHGVIAEAILSERLRMLELPFDSTMLLETSIESGVLIKNRGMVLLYRDNFEEAYRKIRKQDERAAQILRLRVEGQTLQDIGDRFQVSRERIRQITARMMQKFPLLFEDYFSEPYQHFYLPKARFLQAFPEVSAEGYEFLSLRYPHGKAEPDTESLSTYTGLWRRRLREFLAEENAKNARENISKAEVVKRVLIANRNTPLSIEELEEKYYRYIKSRGYQKERLQFNIRTLENYLRNAPNIVYNRENLIRWCPVRASRLFEAIDFRRYQDMAISADLIFRDYPDLMEELGILDSHELFYVIKSAVATQTSLAFRIWCRRVPMLVVGEASEDEQALKLLRELSPVSYQAYYAAYEERYGVRRESSQRNPLIYNTVNQYYTDGMYVIDVPGIDPRDVQPLRAALAKKQIWFIDELETLFLRVCSHTSEEAINAVAFRTIGYTLNTTYAYDASYGTALHFFEQLVFTADKINLELLDRRILDLAMFATVLEKKKQNLDYIETAPRVLMSRRKVEEVYGLKVEDIRAIQTLMSAYYELPYFNGRSLWNKVKKFPLIRRLRGNDWMLTCIMRQQAGISSFSVAGGLILSRNSASLSLSRMCEWLAAVRGRMSLQVLEKELNGLFGTRVPAYKLAEKLRNSGNWNQVLTDTEEPYGSDEA